LFLSSKIKLLGSLDGNILEIISDFLVADASPTWLYGYLVNYRINCIYTNLDGKNIYITGVCKNIDDIYSLYKNYPGYQIIIYKVGNFVRGFDNDQCNLMFGEIFCFSKLLYRINNLKLMELQIQQEQEQQQHQNNYLKKQQKICLRNQQKQVKLRFKIHRKGNKTNR